MPRTTPMTMTGPSPTQSQTLRLASVSFLNAKPLIWGLEDAPDIDLKLDVPSGLLWGLERDHYDVALLPVIDYQRMDDLRIVPAGGIGCDGGTLTVRIFSKKPVDQIRTLACDTDSHTSVALASILFAELYHTHPGFIDWSRQSPEDRPADARLLIGDKVVCEEPAGFEHQIDLGAAWKELTGLPFVFAAWTARKGVDLRDLPHRLEQAKRQGLANVKQIIKRHATPKGWPAGLALQYLTLYLKFDVGPRQLEAISRFHQLAAKHGIIPSPVRPLELYPAT